jgi:hypothetical protein
MCECKRFIEYRPTYYNDFVYNPSYFKCIDCGRWFNELDVNFKEREKTIEEIIFDDNPPIPQGI